MEYKLWALLLLIADREGLRRPRPHMRGYILDAGAHDGSTAAMLATALRRLNLRVLALEPLVQNVRAAEARAQRLPNLEVKHLALGDVHGSTGFYPAEYDMQKSNGLLQIARWRDKDNQGSGTYPITTVDTLFAVNRGRTLVLAHLDLEGHEAEALRGANRTLWRDRPVVTVETFPISMPKWHAEVMALLEALNYEMYTVDEKVGWPPDGRNHVGIPREDQHLRFVLDNFFRFEPRRKPA